MVSRREGYMIMADGQKIKLALGHAYGGFDYQKDDEDNNNKDWPPTYAATGYNHGGIDGLNWGRVRDNDEYKDCIIMEGTNLDIDTLVLPEDITYLSLDYWVTVKKPVVLPDGILELYTSYDVVIANLGDFLNRDDVEFEFRGEEEIDD